MKAMKIMSSSTIHIQIYIAFNSFFKIIAFKSFFMQSGFMNPFQEILQNITLSPHYARMQQLGSPLNEQLGINHFWYYKISLSGNYSYVGSHQKWNEFSAEQKNQKHFTCLRHPECMQRGVHLMKASKDREYQKVLDIAWEKFRINFSLNLVNTLPDGIEAFGFATHSNDFYAEKYLLNNLPQLHNFTKIFKTDCQALLRVLDENQVHLPSHFDQKYYERPKTVLIPFKRDQLLDVLGFAELLGLTSREKDILKFVASGSSVVLIAARLGLSIKTVENYLSAIKYKFSCESDAELIYKAQKIELTSFFDI